jgi:hypothetical protein
MFDFKGKKPTEKDLNLYERLDNIEAKKANRSLRNKIILGASIVLGILVVSSPFIAPEQVKSISVLIDTIFKYIPIVG